MKRIGFLLVVLFLFSGFIMAEHGPYAGYMTSDGSGKNRSVLIVNTVTGDFEVYDIDNKGYNRKEDIEYYDCVKYNRAIGEREIHMIRINDGR